MGTINFIITEDSQEHIFNKNIFRYMSSIYSSGETGTIIITFAAEGDLIDEDAITLVVKKAYLSNVVKDISESLNSDGHTEIRLSTHSQGVSKSIYQQILSMAYTAG